MTWVRLDDLFPDHPKIMGLSDRAFRLHIVGLCYSARALTDGHVPEQIVHRSCRNHARVVSELVDAGIWAKRGDGYDIHDYTEYQPTREKVLAERDATNQRVQQWRQRKRGSNAVTPTVTNPQPSSTSNGVGNAPPDPTHPYTPLPPHSGGTENGDLEPLTPRDAGTNPRAQRQKTKAQRAHASFVARTKGLYQQWLAEPDADPTLVAHQIRQAYPDIADEVLA